MEIFKVIRSKMTGTSPRFDDGTFKDDEDQRPDKIVSRGYSEVFHGKKTLFRTGCG